MYDPLALDRQRVDQDRLRRRAERAPRPDDRARSDQHVARRRSRLTLRVALAGLAHRRPATDC